MATKRRRVWANWYPALGEAPAHWGTRLGAKSDARMAAQPGAELVSLIERLPGDVVLSREDADCVRRSLEIVRLDAGMDDAHRIDRVLALLRGRR